MFNFKRSYKKFNAEIQLEVIIKLISTATKKEESYFSDDSYKFLVDNKYLGTNICLLGLGGSYAYGTNNENSDLDVRGIAINPAEEILTGKDFEQVCNTATDTTIYSMNKMIKLLSGCNPNVIEILGLKPEHYLMVDCFGEKLLKNKHLFLSKQAANTFGGYAYAQLRRLDNKAARDLEDKKHEEHILNSIKNASVNFKERYFPYTEDQIKLYVDKSDKEDKDYEIFMDLNLKHYPLRDFNGLMSETRNVVKDYDTLGHRNKNAIARDKLSKHQMHLLRLFMMCIDILEKQEIITYREEEHDLLMSIRNGDFLDSEQQPTKEFDKMVEQYQTRMQKALETSKLPDKPDMNKIHNLQADINAQIVKEWVLL